MRSSGNTPIAPLKTLLWSAVSLSARTTEGALSPVFLQPGCPRVPGTTCRQAGFGGTDVTNATIKSTGVSHLARITHGRRFVEVSAVNGNAAITISPGLNIRQAASEIRIAPTGKHVGVRIEVRLCHQKIEATTVFRNQSRLVLGRLVRLQGNHRQTRLGWKQPSTRRTPRAVFFDRDRDEFHCPPIYLGRLSRQDVTPLQITTAQKSK